MGHGLQIALRSRRRGYRLNSSTINYVWLVWRSREMICRREIDRNRRPFFDASRGGFRLRGLTRAKVETDDFLTLHTLVLKN